MIAEKIIYNRTDGSFTVSNVRLGRYPFYISGDTATGNSQSINVTNARASIREPAYFHPTLTAESLSYTVGKSVSAVSPHIGIGGIRPITWPQITHRVDLPLISYISLNGGFRSSLGVYAEAEVQLPIGNGIKAGGMLGGYSARGFMAGPSAEYNTITSAGNSIAGDLQTGFINDHGDKLTDLLGRPVPENRGYVQWWHAQDLTDSLRLTAQFNYWRDSEILRDFQPRHFFDVQQPDNYLQAVYTGSDYFLTVITRADPNDFHRVQQRLPEIRFDLLPVELGSGTGLFQNLQASFAALREETPGGLGPTVRSDRLDAYYSLGKTFTHDDWFSFRPIAGTRVTHYQRAVGNKDHYTRTLGELGFDLAVRTSSVSDYQNNT